MFLSKLRTLHPFDIPTLVRFSLGVFIFVGYLTALRFFSTQQKSVASLPAPQPNETSEIKPVLGNGQSNFVAGQPSELFFQLDTDNKPIMGVQLVYTVKSDVLPALTSDQIIIPEESGFVPIHTSVEPTSGGYTVKIAARPAGDFSPELTYSNDSFVNIAKMSVIPAQSGDINIHFDPTLSTVLDLNTTDALKPLADFSVAVQ